MEIDLSDHVIIPKNDFLELQTDAWNAPPMAVKDRVGASMQAGFLFASIALAVTGATWGWAKALDWREERAFQRRIRAREQGIR